MVRVLDKDKLLNFMGERKDYLYNHIIRDFGGEYTHVRTNQHNEVKYWKEAIERGEFDTEIQDVYIILSKVPPEIVDFTFYIDEESAKKRVEELNNTAGMDIFWYISIHSNFRNAGKLEKIGEV